MNLFRKDSHIDIMEVYSTCNNCLRFKEAKADSVVNGNISEKKCPLCGKLLSRHIVTQTG